MGLREEEMVSKRLCASTLIAFLTIGLLTMPVFAADLKFVGEVNDTYQLVTDDQIYEIDDNEIGDRLVYEHMGDKVEVTGTLREVDDAKIITVKYFKLVSE
jgi:hypothetical protein